MVLVVVEIGLIIFVVPEEPFAVFPLAFPRHILRADEHALPVLLSILPHSFIAAAVGVGIDSIAILLIVDVLPFIFSAVGPLIVTLAMHIILFPVAFIHSSIFPSIYSIACDFVLLPVPFELAVVGPCVDTVAILHAVFVLADILGPIDPCLLALTLLHIVDPLALVATSIHVGVNAEPTGLIRLELADVYVALGVPEGSFTLRLILEPISLVHGAIDPFLYAVAAPLFGP